MVSLVFGNIVATVLIALSFILPVATPLAVLMFILGVLSLAILINREQIWAKYILDCEVFIGNENPRTTGGRGNSS